MPLTALVFESPGRPADAGRLERGLQLHEASWQLGGCPAGGSSCRRLLHGEVRELRKLALLVGQELGADPELRKLALLVGQELGADPRNVEGDLVEYLVDPNRGFGQVVGEVNTDRELAAEYTHGLGLVSQQRGGLASFYHQDALGSTRQLTDTAGAVTDRYAYSGFGTLEQQQGSTVNDFLFAGEQLDPASGLYYLRARYLDPKNGRFLSADPEPGIVTDPLSFNAYQYADLDPVNNLDPTGRFTMSELNASNAIRGNLSRMAIPAFRGVVNRVVSTVVRVARAGSRTVVQEIKRCIKTPRNCRIAPAFIVTGFLGTWETSRHILDAQLGNGTSLLPSPPALWRVPPGRKGWYRRASVECHDTVRPAAIAQAGKVVACDEYPYNSSRPGGQRTYPILTSLRFVGNAESLPQATFLNAFYTTCRVPKTGPFRRRFFMSFGLPIVPNFHWCGTRR